MPTSMQIQALVREMDQSIRKHKALKETNNELWKTNIMKENMKLYDEYPTIFDMHLKGQLDETFFYMLKMKRKMELGEVTEDQASAAVGQKLFNRYVDPVVKSLPTPSSLSYEEYYKQYAGQSKDKSGEL